MSKDISLLKKLTRNVFDTLDNWMAVNKIKGDANIIRKINAMFPEHGIEQGRFSRLRNGKETLRLDELEMIADCLNMPIDKLLQRQTAYQQDEAKTTAADVLNIIFRLHKLTNLSFRNFRETIGDGKNKDFIGIYFNDYILTTEFHSLFEQNYFINDAIAEWSGLLQSISGLPQNAQEGIIHGWQKNKLEIAQNIRIDGIYVYKYNVFSKEYSMITTPEELPYGYYEEFE